MPPSTRPFGELLRTWRLRRRLSQLTLATEAEISTRHLSFLETGRSSPSREMVLRLSRVLSLPLRERNVMLHAAGLAPAFSERPLTDPALDVARQAVELVLRGHEPHPALAVDTHWTLLSANAAVPPLLAGVAPALLAPPVNVLRLSLHPDGLAPRIHNLAEWRAHLLERLRHQISVTADPTLADLLGELLALPAPDEPPPASLASGRIVVPLELRSEGRLLRLLSTTTVFGTPIDVTLAELAIESFFPADAETAAHLRDAAEHRKHAAA